MVSDEELEEREDPDSDEVKLGCWVFGVSAEVLGLRDLRF